jgi:hypothetical protein
MFSLLSKLSINRRISFHMSTCTELWMSGGGLHVFAEDCEWHVSDLCLWVCKRAVVRTLTHKGQLLIGVSWKRMRK